MTQFYQFLFSEKPKHKLFSLTILVLRMLFGFLLMSHGIQKWAHFDVLSTTFPDPIGLGSGFSLTLVIFAELFCSIFFIAGFLFRIVLIPMIFSMATAFFWAHGASIVNGGELAFIYLCIFIILYVTGPGRYSFDRILSKGIALTDTTIA